MNKIYTTVNRYGYITTRLIEDGIEYCIKNGYVFCSRPCRKSYTVKTLMFAELYKTTNKNDYELLLKIIEKL